MQKRIRNIKNFEDKRHRLSRRAATTLLLMSLGLLTGLLALAPGRPRLVWNLSASVSPGLYYIDQATPSIGDIVAISPGADLSTDLATRGILSAGRLLLKPLAGRMGDRVCRSGDIVTINTRRVARALTRTSLGRALPEWSGCHVLDADRIAVVSPHPASYDSRYFGPIDADQVIGVARPVLTFPPTGVAG